MKSPFDCAQDIQRMILGKNSKDIQMFHALVKSSTSFNKCFGIGCNKTGTTTLDFLMRWVYGYRSDQRLIERSTAIQVLDGNFFHLSSLMEHLDFHQDVPCSLGNIYELLDVLFPRSKFILTVREEDKWFSSFFHQYYYPAIYPLLAHQYVGVMTADHYVFPSYLLRWFVNEWGRQIQSLRLEVIERHGSVPPANVLKEQIMTDSLFPQHCIDSYMQRNADIERYFSDKQGKLLVVDVSSPDILDKISSFLGVPMIVGGPSLRRNAKNRFLGFLRNRLSKRFYLHSSLHFDWSRLEFDQSRPFQLGYSD